MSDKETLKIYDAKAQEYANLTSKDVESPDLAAFINALPAKAHVLDLGCGPGQFSARMAQLGLTVEATDASAEMVKLANAHGGVSARQETFDALDAVDRFDGIYANFSLLHAKREAVPTHITQIARALKQGGVFHIGMKTGTGESRDGIGRRYSYFTEDELEEIITANGLKIIHRNHGADVGLSGEIADWVVLQSRKT